MIIPSFPSEDTLLRLFSARTPRYLTQLFYCYHKACTQCEVNMHEHNGKLRLTVNGELDYGYQDMMLNTHYVSWDSPHSLVNLGNDIVGLTRYSKPLIMQFDIARMKWLEPIKLDVDANIIGASHWLKRDPKSLCVYYCTSDIIGYVKIDRFTHRRVAGKQLATPCSTEKLFLKTMNNKRVLIYRRGTPGGRSFAWVISPSSIDIAAQTNFGLREIVMDHVKDDIVRITGSKEVYRNQRWVYENFDIQYDVKELREI